MRTLQFYDVANEEEREIALVLYSNHNVDCILAHYHAMFNTIELSYVFELHNRRRQSLYKLYSIMIL